MISKRRRVSCALHFDFPTSRGDDMEVGLVAHILGWSREGVLVLQLYDTVGYFDKYRAEEKMLEY